MLQKLQQQQHQHQHTTHPHTHTFNTVRRRFDGSLVVFHIPYSTTHTLLFPHLSTLIKNCPLSSLFFVFLCGFLAFFFHVYHTLSIYLCYIFRSPLPPVPPPATPCHPLPHPHGSPLFPHSPRKIDSFDFPCRHFSLFHCSFPILHYM